MRSRKNFMVGQLFWILTGAAFLAMLLFGNIDRVGAKGPESGTITGPGITEPIELVENANRELLDRLMEQTGLWFATGDLPSPIEKPAGNLGPGYTLTWINAGPPGKSVSERTINQVLYLNAENGPLIHTPDQQGLQGWGLGVVGWFAAPSGLPQTLAELGVPIAPASAVSEQAPINKAADTGLAETGTINLFRYLLVVGFAVVLGLAGEFYTRRKISW